MKKALFFLAASALLAFGSALAFANNVVAVFRWWRAFLAAGGDTAGMPAHAPGFLPWLDWSAVDYSAVTTLIPLIGFLALTRASWRLLRKRPIAAADFPFFAGSDQLNVALGLFGTLWGIIVIGYFKLETVTMADLMQCLHTALFSTLMAVVWVFLVDRPLLRPLFRKLLDESGLAEAEEGDLAGAVDRLVTRLDAASESFDARQKHYEAAFDARQKHYEAAFDARQKRYEAAFDARQADIAARFEKRLADYDAAFEKRLSDYEAAFERRQKEYVETFRREIDLLRNRVAAAETRADASEAKLDAVARALRS